MPNHDITYCVPYTHSCATKSCPRHESNAPTGVMLSWRDFWNICLEKTKTRYYNTYPVYRGKLNGNTK